MADKGATPSITDIVGRLGSATVTVVEAALAELAAWVEAAKPGPNPLLAALGPARPAEAGEDDAADTAPATGPLPALDAALDQHLGALSPAVLAPVFAAMFRAATDDFPAAGLIASEIAARGDDDAQCALVDGFVRANLHHEPGNRAHDDTVHDAMIEDVFPALRGPALARLLAWCSDSHLDEHGGDAMLGLFEPALNRAADGERDALLERLQAYTTGAIELENAHQVVDSVWQMLERIPAGPTRDACDAMREGVEAAFAAYGERAAIEAQLESGDVETVTAGVLATLALPPDEALEIADALRSASRTRALGPGARRGLLVLWKRAGDDLGIAQVISGSADSVPPAELRADLDVLGLAPPALGTVIRLAIEDGIDVLPAAILDELRTMAGELEGTPAK